MKNFNQKYPASNNDSLVELTRPIHLFIDDTYDMIRTHPLWQSSSVDELGPFFSLDLSLIPLYYAIHTNDTSYHICYHHLSLMISLSFLKSLLTDNVMESLEKFIMSKLYSRIFSCELELIQHNKLLEEKLECMCFLTKEHLGLSISNSLWNPVILESAGRELRSMNSFKAPKDKVVCLLNCCHIIINFLKHIKREESKYSDPLTDENGEGVPNQPLSDREATHTRGGAGVLDDFLILLILVLVKTRVSNPLLNLEYIISARHPSQLTPELHYLCAQIKSAMAFVHQLSPEDDLNIDPQHYYIMLEANAQRRSMGLSLESDPDVLLGHLSGSPLATSNHNNKLIKVPIFWASQNFSRIALQQCLDSLSPSSPSSSSSISASASSSSTSSSTVTSPPDPSPPNDSDNTTTLLSSSQEHKTNQSESAEVVKELFVGKEAGDLQIRDVNELLTEYQRLARALLTLQDRST